MTVTVSGSALLPDGSPFASSAIVFERQAKAVEAVASSVLVPERVSVTTDSAGAFSLELEPGNYLGAVATSTGGVSFAFVVPTDAATADLSELIDAALIQATPAAVAEAQAAADRAEAAAQALGATTIYPPTSAQLIAWATAAKSTVVTLRQILGTGYTTAQDGGAILSAVLPALATAGLTVTDPDGLTVRCTSSIRPATSKTRLVFGKATTIIKDFASTGNTNALFCQASASTYTDYLYIRGGKWQSLQDGVMFAVFGDYLDIADMEVTGYKNGQAFAFGGNYPTINNIRVIANDNGPGTGAFRYLYGKGLRAVNCFARCGDDAYQFVPGGTAGSANWDKGISDGYYINCYAESYLARIGIVQIPLANNPSNLPYKGIKRVGFIGCTGTSGSCPFQLIHETPTGSTIVGTDDNCIDDVLFDGCRGQARSPVDRPTELTQAFLISSQIPNGVRKVTIRDTSIWDVTNSVGVKVDADGIDLTLANCSVEGESTALQLRGSGTVKILGGSYRTKDNGGLAIFPDSTKPHTADDPISVLAGSTLKILIDNEALISDVATGKDGISLLGSTLKVGSLRVTKATGATGTSAIRTGSGAAVSLAQPITGDVDTLSVVGSGTTTIIYGPGGGIKRGVTTITSLTNEQPAAADLSSLVLDAGDLPGPRVRDIQSDGFMVGDQVEVVKTLTSTGTATWRYNSAPLAVLQLAGDSFRATWTGTGFQVNEIVSAASLLPPGTLHITTDGNTSVTVATMAARVFIDGPLGRSVLYTLAPTNAKFGDRIRVERTDTTANTWTLQKSGGAGTLFVLSKAGEWAEVTYNGTAWEVTGQGLTVTSTKAGLAPPSGGGTTNFLRADGAWAAPAGGGGGVTDGDKGDITVSGGGTVWTIDAGAVALSNMANLVANSLIGNNTGSAATPVALTASQVKTLLGIAASDVSGLATVATSGSASDLGSGTLNAARLPTSGVTAATYGGATQSLTLAIDAAGRVTSASAQTVTPAWGSITSKPTTLAGYGITDTLTGYVHPPSGETLAAGAIGSPTGTTAFFTNNHVLFPYVPQRDLSVTAFTVNITVAASAGNTLKLTVYSSDSNGRPNAVLLETGTVASDTTGMKTISATISLTKNVQYWFGVRVSANCTLTAFPSAQAIPINAGAASTSVRATVLRATTYATAAPTPWTWSSSEVTSNNPPAIWLTV